MDEARKFSVLIVDDQENWLKLLTELLQPEFAVTPVNTYTDAINAIRTQSVPFHVVITDMRLEDAEPSNEDGMRLLEELSKRGEETKAIMVTGYATIPSTKRAVGQLKAYDYLEKHPSDGTDFDFNALVACVRRAAKEADAARKEKLIDIFVVMPFAKEYDPIYAYIQEVARGMNRVCKRADQNLGEDAGDEIISDIHYGIQNSEIVIAELSGCKPNVFFEIGVSYALQKKVVLIAQESEKESIPEILSGHRIIFYRAQLGGEVGLKKDLRDRLSEKFSNTARSKVAAVEVDAALCFVISSPNEDGRDTYEAIIRNPLKALGANSIYLWDDNEIAWHRLDAETGKPALIERKLREAVCVVADLSWDDPTAFYLAGVTYGLRKKFKFLYHQNQDPPFDVRHLHLLRHQKVTESDREKARKLICEWLRMAMKQVSAADPALESETTAAEIGRVTSILFLAAEPSDQVRLGLGKEFREIRDELLKSQHRDQLKLELPQLTLRPRDIGGALLVTSPQIIHFSGHGGSAGQLYFETETGESLPIDPKILADFFEQFSNKINCVVLNACYSVKQAKAISKHIEYVIGMRQRISNKAAIAFSIGLYQALGAGKNIEEAFKLGKAYSGMQNAPEYRTPVLLKRNQKK